VKYPVTFMLDTNTFSYIASGRSPKARQQFKAVHGSDIVVISAITEAELHYGLAKNSGATRVRQAVEELMGIVTILPWDSIAAREYGTMRSAMTKQGKTLAAMDLLIAAHATSIGGVLVTGDQALRNAGGITVNWADDV
jgi:tRNA(fMet)-specific endonuclease VapC